MYGIFGIAFAIALIGVTLIISKTIIEKDEMEFEMQKRRTTAIVNGYAYPHDSHHQRV